MSFMDERSRQAMADAFSRAARGGLLRAPEDALEIQPAPDRRGPLKDEDLLMVITTSSFAFRLHVLFHIAETAENRAYYAAAAGAKLQTTFAEAANLCCGALNRELAEDFPHLGMSIPFVLRARCLDFLDELSPEYISRYAITVNGSARLEATLCMCCSARVDIASRLHATAAASGELELF